MDSKLQDFNLSPSMRSNQGEPSAPKKKIKLTLFEDLLDNPSTDNLHSGANFDAHGEKGSSSSSVNKNNSWLSIGFNRVSDDNIVSQSIKKSLVSSLNSGGFHVQVEAIYKNGHSSTIGRAKFQSYGMYSTAVKEKCGGNAHVRWAWYGASKNEITGILSCGFSLPLNNGIYGHSFCFSAANHPLESLRFSTVDEEGLTHMLFCRVILGKVEVVTPGSGQHSPSSEEFDSGVDNIEYPKKFIIWNSKVNTHVLPEFIVNFRTSSNCSGEN